MADAIIKLTKQTVQVTLRGAQGPRGLASGPLVDGAVGADEITDDAGAQAAIRAKLGVGPALPALSAYGATDTTVAARDALDAAIAVIPSGGALYVEEPVDIGTSAPDNPGIGVVGAPVHYSPSGTGSAGNPGGARVWNKPGRDPAQTAWGWEYLGPRFFTRLQDGDPVSIALIGDSNTSAYGGPYLANLLRALPNCTVVNYAVAGTTFEHWRTDTGAINGTGFDMVSVLAAGHDLLIDLYGGTNDPFYGGSVETFEASKIAGYDAIRADTNGGVRRLSIAMVTAVPQNDGSVNTGTDARRDELFLAQVRPVIQSLAQRYGCAFVEKNARVPDAWVDWASGAAQDSNLDNNRVHTLPWLSRSIAQWVFDDLIPAAFREGGTGGAMFGDVLDGITPQVLPASFPRGVTISRAEGGSPAWPYNGFVVTLMPISPAGAFGLQINWAFSGGAPIVALRLAAAGVWGAWGWLGQDIAVDVTPASGFTLPADNENMCVTIDGAVGHGQGYVNMTSPAALTAGQAIATIPTDRYRPRIQKQWANLLVWNGATFERLRGTITTAGTITCAEAGSLLAQRVYLDDSWLRPA